MTPLFVLMVLLLPGCDDKDGEVTASPTGPTTNPTAAPPVDSIDSSKLTEPIVLLDAPFKSATIHGDWKKGIGAQTGNEGPVSELIWDPEIKALQFFGDEETVRWISLSRTIDTRGARWISFSGQIRTEKLDPSKASYKNCNLYLKVGNDIHGTRVVTGTTDGWVGVRRQLELPPNTTQITLGFFSSIPGTAWFENIRVEAIPKPPWTPRVGGDGHYRYRILPGDTIPDDALLYNQTSYQAVSAYLGVTEPGPDAITYYKYPDLDTIEAMTGKRGNAHRVGNEIHSIWPTDRHEIVHVLAAAGWGDPPALLAEGLAVHLSGSWQDQPVRDFARKLCGKKNRWLNPSSILDSAAFRAKPDLDTYAISGAFVEWLLTVRDKDTVKKLYNKLDNTQPVDKNRRLLETTLDLSMGRIDEQFFEWVSTDLNPD